MTQPHPTPNALQAAEIILQLPTTYGDKTVEGIAAIIDRHTLVSVNNQMLDALRELVLSITPYEGMHGPAIRKARAAIKAASP